jgi:hypothetical protein
MARGRRIFQQIGAALKDFRKILWRPAAPSSILKEVPAKARDPPDARGLSHLAQERIA